jgi:hypothetical protein
MNKIFAPWFGDFDLKFEMHDINAPEGLCCITKVTRPDGIGLGFRMDSLEPEQALLIGLCHIANSIEQTRRDVILGDS